MLKFDLEKASQAYGNFLTHLGIDWENDPDQKDTPRRVAKSFTEDLFKGLFTEEPKITTFENIDGYAGMVFNGNIPVKSICAHHHLPFIGVAHVAYLVSNKNYIGLSKLNRVVDHFARRPQVQERLTMQIFGHYKQVLGTEDVAVTIEAKHLCTSCRGVHHDSTMMTTELGGKFRVHPEVRMEFQSYINRLK